MLKPRNAYHWPNPAEDFFNVPVLDHGSVGTLGPSPDTRGPMVANILVPDITEPHGWRNWWVYRDSPPNEPPRVGFH